MPIEKFNLTLTNKPHEDLAKKSRIRSKARSCHKTKGSVRCNTELIHEQFCIKLGLNFGVYFKLTKHHINDNRGCALHFTVLRQTDPEYLSKLAKGKLTAKIELLQKALKGSVGAHQMQMLKLQIQHIDFLSQSIKEMDDDIKKNRRLRRIFRSA